MRREVIWPREGFTASWVLTLILHVGFLVRVVGIAHCAFPAARSSTSSSSRCVLIAIASAAVVVGAYKEPFFRYYRAGRCGR